MARSSFAWSAFQLTKSFQRKFISPDCVKITIPGGFPYEAFDGNSHIKPWGALNLVESSRSFGFSQNHDDSECFLGFHEMFYNMMGFIASCSLKLSPDLYNVHVIKSPLIMTKKLLHVGTKSVNILTVITHPEIQQPFIECEISTVFVSRETRRPASPPESWTAKYQPYSQKDRAWKWKLTVPRPDTITSYPLVIQPSDCDAYSHVNWTNYLKFCYDAFVGSSFKNGQIKQPKIKSASISYLKEGTVGTQLSVDFWSNSEKNETYFEMLDENKNAVCHAQFEVYPEID